MFWDECGETLEQVGWRNCGCPIMGSIQSQVGWSFERPGLVEGVPAMAWGWNCMSFRFSSIL